MDELLLKRIVRRLERLPEDQAYRVLDYVEFLESKYGAGSRRETMVDKVADRVHDTMRAARLPAAAIRGTMGAVDAAARLMDKLAGAGRAAAAELGKTLAPRDKPKEPPAS